MKHKDKLKIFVLPSHTTETHTTGVDFVRMIQPMKHLNEHFDVETTIYDPKVEIKHNEPLEWETIMKDHDIFYFNYLANDWGFAVLGMMARKYGVKLVMDLDDNLWDIRSDNAAQQVYYKGSKALRIFEAICNEVDYITTTNDYLRNLILSHTTKKGDKVGVIPNYIDLDLYTHRSEFKDTEQITLTHFGSTTHFLDLKNSEFFKGVDKIMKEYPNVSFKTVGAFIPAFRQKWGARYENLFGDVDIYKWIQSPDKFPKFMNETDILVVPLEDDLYNRCKSQIKWLEASSAKIPGIWQDIRQYREVIDGENGLLAKTDREWYRAIKKMIDDKEFRRNASEKSFNDIQNWTIQGHINEYADMFKKVLQG